MIAKNDCAGVVITCVLRAGATNPFLRLLYYSAHQTESGFTRTGGSNMQISGFGQVFLAGAFGGLLIEILRWWKLRDAAELPAYRTSPFYWSITIAMICVGG